MRLLTGSAAHGGVRTLRSRTGHQVQGMYNSKQPVLAPAEGCCIHANRLTVKSSRFVPRLGGSTLLLKAGACSPAEPRPWPLFRKRAPPCYINQCHAGNVHDSRCCRHLAMNQSCILGHTYSRGSGCRRTIPCNRSSNICLQAALTFSQSRLQH